MVDRIEVLFQQQIHTWPRLARGVEGLAQAQTRPVRIDWFDVFIRHIPHRVGSTTAAVAATVSAVRAVSAWYVFALAITGLAANTIS